MSDIKQNTNDKVDGSTLWILYFLSMLLRELLVRVWLYVVLK